MAWFRCTGSAIALKSTTGGGVTVMGRFTTPLAQPNPAVESICEPASKPTSRSALVFDVLFRLEPMSALVDEVLGVVAFSYAKSGSKALSPDLYKAIQCNR